MSSSSNNANNADYESLANSHMEDKCYDDWIHGTNLCVTAAKNVCVVTFNGKQCQACTYKPPGQCSRTTIFDGYAIDCSNVDSRYGVGSRLCGTDVILPGSSIDNIQNSPFYTSHGRSTSYHSGSSHHHPGGKNRHHSGSSSHSGSDPVGVLFVMVFVFAFICRLGRCCHIINTMPLRQREQRRRGVYQHVNQQDPTVVGVELVMVDSPDGGVPAAVAKEAIPDTYFDFEFLQALPDDAILLKLKEAMADKEWEVIRDALSSLKEDGQSKHEERSFYFGIIVEEVQKTWPEERTRQIESFCPFLDAWIEAEPNSCDCRILRAQIGASWAWHARSAATADMVGQEQRLLFFDRLKAASVELKEASRLAPEDPLVYSSAIPIAKGLKNNDPNILEVDTCLDRLQNTAHEPLLFRFHSAALEYYCSKWHGSHRQMFEYARSITSGLPAGHPLWALIPMAHYERNLIEQRRNYWRQAAVVTEIRQAYRHAFPGASETSSQATTSTEKYLEWTSRNYFAFALIMAGLVGEARQQIRVIGRRPTKRPWWEIRRYKAYANALGFDVQPALPVAEDAPALVAQIV